MNKKTVIITGSSKGIGLATAERFAAEGYAITLVGRDSEELEKASQSLIKSYGVEVIMCVGDLAELDFVKSIIDDTYSKWGRIDAVINNAAWRTIQSMRTIEIESWQETLDVCITAPAFLSKWAAAIMERDNSKGVIINVSSVMSSRAAGNSPAYIASKGAIESLTKELAVTYGRSGIRVLSVRPGYIETSLSKDYTNDVGFNISDQIGKQLISFTPLARPGNSTEIANAIYWLCTSEASFITGTDLLIDGGFLQNFSDYSVKKLQFPSEF